MGGLIQSSAGMLLTEGGQCVMERKRREKEKHSVILDFTASVIALRRASAEESNIQGGARPKQVLMSTGTHRVEMEM